VRRSSSVLLPSRWQKRGSPCTAGVSPAGAGGAGKRRPARPEPPSSYRWVIASLACGASLLAGRLRPGGSTPGERNHEYFNRHFRWNKHGVHPCKSSTTVNSVNSVNSWRFRQFRQFCQFFIAGPRCAWREEPAKNCTAVAAVQFFADWVLYQPPASASVKQSRFRLSLRRQASWRSLQARF